MLAEHITEVIQAPNLIMANVLKIENYLNIFK